MGPKVKASLTDRLCPTVDCQKVAFKVLLARKKPPLFVAQEAPLHSCGDPEFTQKYRQGWAPPVLSELVSSSLLSPGLPDSTRRASTSAPPPSSPPQEFSSHKHLCGSFPYLLRVPLKCHSLRGGLSVTLPHCYPLSLASISSLPAHLYLEVNINT